MSGRIVLWTWVKHSAPLLTLCLQVEDFLRKAKALPRFAGVTQASVLSGLVETIDCSLAETCMCSWESSSLI
jgi:hypothetical protein